VDPFRSKRSEKSKKTTFFFKIFEQSKRQVLKLSNHAFFFYKTIKPRQKLRKKN